MTVRFLRSAEIIIASVSTGVGLTIKDLRIEFELTKDLFGFPNLVKIDIFNLKEESRNKIKTEFDSLLLNIGYGNKMSNVFTGQIRNAVHVKNGVDWVSTIYAGDGDKDFKTGFVSLSLESNTSTEDILTEVLSQLPNTIKGVFKGIGTDAQKGQGVSITGQLKEVLDQLSSEADCDWSIQDGKLQFLGFGEVTDRKATVISSNTGMMGSPTVTEKGVKVQALIVPELTPGQTIEIRSLGNNVQFGNMFFTNPPVTVGAGFWKVVKIVMKGSTHANDWVMNINGRKF